MKRLAATALLVAACAARPHPPSAGLPPPAVASSAPPVSSMRAAELAEFWRTRTPAERARVEADVVARLTTEAATPAYPGGGGFLSTYAPEQGHALLPLVSPDARVTLARALLAWLIARAWAMEAATPVIRASLDVLGPEGYDAIADACDRSDAPYGHTSMLLYADAAGHDALLTRLLPRARRAFEAARERLASSPPPDARDPALGRVATLVQALLTLDRPEPVHRFLLGVAADGSMPARLRLEAFLRMTRSDLPFVEPAVVALAGAPGDVEVRVAAIDLLGRMIDQAPDAHLDALYERTPPGAPGVPLRVALGVAFLRRLRLDAGPRLVGWMRRGDALRAGRDEADAWAHELARERLRDDALADTRMRRTPEGRALAILTWSWFGEDAARVEAMVPDPAPLRGPSWQASEVGTLGALARWALAHHNRDSMIRLDGCCREH